MIAVLDFGSSLVESLSKVLGEFGIPHRLLPFDVEPSEIVGRGAKGIILSGSPDMLSEDQMYVKGDDGEYHPVEGRRARRPHPGVYELGLPILGICYGHQLIAEHFGATVERSPRPEKTPDDGMFEFRVLAHSPLFDGLPQRFPVYMHHMDYVPRLPKGFSLLGETDRTPIAAMSRGHIFGIQFHPEGDREGVSRLVLRNFARLCDRY